MQSGQPAQITGTQVSKINCLETQAALFEFFSEVRGVASYIDSSMYDNTLLRCIYDYQTCCLYVWQVGLMIGIRKFDLNIVCMVI